MEFELGMGYISAYFRRNKGRIFGDLDFLRFLEVWRAERREGGLKEWMENDGFKS